MFNSYLELYDEGRKRLAAAHIKDAEFDARALLFYVYDMDMQKLLMEYTRPLTSEEIAKEDRYLECVDERARRTPLQYITHEQNFCGIDIYVDESVLIPRQDTEVLIEKLIADNPPVNEGQDKRSLLDVCTGSGCIVIAAGKLGGYDKLYAADISRAALEIADRNATSAGLDITFYESNMFSELADIKDIDIITCNPPYIRSSVVDILEPEVKDHEPRLALDGEEDGLKFYRILIEEAYKHMKKGGRIYMEIGYDQAEDVSALLKAYDYEDIEVTKDLTGLDRVVSARHL